MKNKIAFVLILLAAFFIRIYGLNWDQGFHLHPDERMLIMVADRINLFKNLNPDFFNYGSLPIYVLRGVSQIINLATYDGMLNVGRNLSVIFDLITICLIYKIGQLLFKINKIALFSTLLYTLAFFPIQNSHFFVVDVLLNTLITGLLFLLLKYLKSQSMKKILIIGIFFAAMMATKFTSVIFYPLIVGVLFFKNWKQWKNLFICLLIFHFSFFIFYFFMMPYAFIENAQFVTDIRAQLKMNSNPYIFPYTLQYVGTLPYLYYLKNIFWWGLGPAISVLGIFGIIVFTKYQILNIKYQNDNAKIKNKENFLHFNFSFLFLLFYFSYFLVIGRSAVKFMRYMLPLYPFFVLLAGYGLYKLYRLYKPFTYVLITAVLLWSFMFINIYSQPHTRIAASDWILKNIPAGKTLAVEHWDDRMPIYNGEKYNYQELTLYDRPDDEIKWQVLNEKLNKTDYIIIASNRLYIPLQKLAIYPKTAEYYQKLFSNKLPFKKIAEFSSYPKFQILNFEFEINDDSADESFTVYDHPKILIFKKTF